jgi:hypothetical protein
MPRSACHDTMSTGYVFSRVQVLLCHLHHGPCEVCCMTCAFFFPRHHVTYAQNAREGMHSQLHARYEGCDRVARTRRARTLRFVLGACTAAARTPHQLRTQCCRSSRRGPTVRSVALVEGHRMAASAAECGACSTSVHVRVCFAWRARLVAFPYRCRPTTHRNVVHVLLARTWPSRG